MEFTTNRYVHPDDATLGHAVERSTVSPEALPYFTSEPLKCSLVSRLHQSSPIGEDFMSVPAAILISALVSGLLATSVSFYLNRRYSEVERKRDVLRRFVGSRYRLTGQYMGGEGEPFIALNEVFVVYAGHPQVISKLRKMHEELSIPDRLPDNIVSLVKAMAEAAKVPIRELNDDFITRPFTPPGSPQV